jgi:hypothetical protein
MFREQADWTFILLLELSTKEMRHLSRKVPLQAYHTSQYMVRFFSSNGAALSQEVPAVK